MLGEEQLIIHTSQNFFIQLVFSLPAAAGGGILNCV